MLLAGGTRGGNVRGIGQAVGTLGVADVAAVLSGRALGAATAVRHQLAGGYFILAVEGACTIQFFLACPLARVLPPWTPLTSAACSCSSFLFFRVAVVFIIEVTWVRGHRVAKLVWMQSRQRTKRI